MEERLMEERKNMLLDLMKGPDTYVPMKLKSWRCFLVRHKGAARRAGRSFK